MIAIYCIIYSLSRPEWGAPVGRIKGGGRPRQKPQKSGQQSDAVSLQKISQ